MSLEEEKRKFGLIGKNISYSFSPSYFQSKFERENIDAQYDLYDIESIQEVEKILTSPLSGLNVTIPYKQEIIPFLDELTGAAKEINAVNTIQFKSGKFIGHNTDVIGFKQSLLPLLKSHSNNALVFGTGGASKAVLYVLDELKIPYTLVSRTPQNGQLSYDELTPEIVRNHPILINCTPLGTFPHTEKHPTIPYEGITSNHLAYDLIYNPAKTTFLAKAQQQGATIKNGLEMLEKQAQAAWDIWNQ